MSYKAAAFASIIISGVAFTYSSLKIMGYTWISSTPVTEERLSVLQERIAIWSLLSSVCLAVILISLITIRKAEK